MPRVNIEVSEEYAALCKKYGRRMSAQAALILKAWSADATARTAIEGAIGRAAEPPATDVFASNYSGMRR